ncbi:MAG TPA: hypothetical protein VHU86_11095 [Solirubrobacterales bacterium]|jgi:hypothetical protein|nr:hypothetical protein [Solirubrobacterales bacterium]
MTPHRFSILVLIGAMALTLSACGGDSPTTSAGSAAAKPKQQAKRAATGEGCPGQLNGFLGSMSTLRRRLAVGVTYDEYVKEMTEVRAAYDDVPVEQMGLGCLTGAGSPGERALNEYIDAANAWGECLAKAGCDAATIEARLRSEWRVASHFLSLAEQELPGRAEQTRSG